MVGGESVPEEHHALFAQRDEDGSCIPSFQETVPDLKQGRVLLDGVDGGGERDSGGGECLDAVRLDSRDSGPVQRVFWVGIAGDQRLLLQCGFKNRIDQGLIEKTLTVILEENRIRSADQFPCPRNDGITVRSCRREDFPIDPDHLLALGDDPGFHDGRHRGIGEQSIRRYTLFPHELCQFFPGGVRPHDSQHGHCGGEFPEVACNVGGTSRVTRLPFDIHHRYGSLRRDPRHATPDKFVQHQVTQDKESL